MKRPSDSLRIRLVATFTALLVATVLRPFAATTFPLRIAKSQRYLEDSAGAPYRMIGDSAWSLIAQLESSDVTNYLDDRAARGFNAVIANLLERKFSVNAPADRAGVRPFLAPGGFGDPNPAYFAKAHRVVNEARRRGIAVWLCPAYLGWGGGDEGFFTAISAAGPAALRQYGRFVGRQFKDLPNIIWMLGGDYAFPASMRWLGDELAAGLREGGAQQLMSAHAGRTSAVETFGDRPWLAIDTVYSHAADLRPSLLAVYQRTPRRPFVLIEGIYEGEHDARADQIRRQAWTAMLSGAAGQFFGNNPVWHFDGPTLFPFAGNWRNALDSVGARDMARLGRFFRAHRWPELEPDGEGTLVTLPNGARSVAAAWMANRQFAIAYIPAGDRPPLELTLNLRAFPRPMTAHWVDPSGDVAPREAGRLRAGVDGQPLRLAASRRDGVDWLLVLDAR